MECQARNTRPTRATSRATALAHHQHTLALSSRGRLTEGSSLADALRAELASAPFCPPVTPGPWGLNPTTLHPIVFPLRLPPYTLGHNSYTLHPRTWNLHPKP